VKMDNKIVEIETNKLDFDPKNPRFFRLNDASNAATVIEEMLDDESVHDLMLSIGQQGYFPGEPLLAVKSNGNYIVVEGNRRLALMNPLMILVKIIKLRWIHILSYDQMVSRKINNQTTRCANSIFYTTLFTNSAPNYT